MFVKFKKGVKQKEQFIATKALSQKKNKEINAK